VVERMKSGRMKSVLAWAAGVVLTAATGAATASMPAQPEGARKVIQIPIRTDGPKSLDPVKGSTVYDNQACCQVYETLLEYHYFKEPLELQPLLLAAMPIKTDNADGTRTWKFTLRDDVFFQDNACFPGGKGRKLTTDDVFYSWKRLADPAFELENWWLLKDTIVGFDEFKDAQLKKYDESMKAGNGPVFDYDAPIAGMKKISDLEFEIVLTKPRYQFLFVLAQFQTSIVPREAVERYAGEFTTNPVGTGPFVVKPGQWRPGEFINFDRNPAYRDVKYPGDGYEARDKELGFDKAAGRRLPLVDRVECKFYVPDQVMWLDFQAGTIGYTQVPAEYFEQAFVLRTRQLKEEAKAKGIVSHAVPLFDFIFRGFNMDDPVVGGYTEEKKALRQALSLAIDLEEMNTKFYNGLNIVYDGPIPPRLDGHPEGHVVENNYRGPDIDAAKELLAKAGYPGGKDKNGKQLVIDYYTSRGSNNHEQVQAEQRMFDAIGVKLNARLVDFSELIEAINKKKAQMFGFAWGSDYPDGENNLALFYGPNEAPGANHFNYKRKEFDAMYEQIRVMEPGEARTKMYEQMRDMVIEDTPYIGSQGRTRFYVVNPWLKNLKPSEDFYNWYKYLDVDDSKRK